MQKQDTVIILHAGVKTAHGGNVRKIIFKVLGMGWGVGGCTHASESNNSVMVTYTL